MRGLYVFEKDRIDIHVRNLPDGAVERYERIARAFDPVLAGVRETHAPCQLSFREMYEHSRDPSLPDVYRGLIDDALAVTSAGQYLAAPLVVCGRVAGTINLARVHDAVFSPSQVTSAFAMALHVSSRLSALRALEAGSHAALEELLTQRGREVAELACRGLTTHEIGRVLGVSANTAKKHLRVVYDKLGIATRAELATLLASATVSPLPSRGASRAR